MTSKKDSETSIYTQESLDEAEDSLMNRHFNMEPDSSSGYGSKRNNSGWLNRLNGIRNRLRSSCHRIGNRKLVSIHTPAKWITLALVAVVVLATTLIQLGKLDSSSVAYDGVSGRIGNPGLTFSYIPPNTMDYAKDSEILGMLDNVAFYRNSPRYFKRDWRIAPALYLNKVREQLKSNNGKLPTDLTFEFSWLDWINFDERLQPSAEFLLKHENLAIQSCQEFESLVDFPNKSIYKTEFLNSCHNLTQAEIKSLKSSKYPHFKFVNPIDEVDFTADTRIILGATYLYHEFQSPERLIFVDKNTRTDIIVPISNRTPLKRSAFSKSIAANLNSDKFLEKLPPIDNILKRIYPLILKSYHLYNKKEELLKDVSRITRNSKHAEDTDIHLSSTDFVNNETLSEIEELLVDFQYPNSLDRNLYDSIAKTFSMYPDGNYPKYFHDSLSKEKISGGGGQYDWRFVNKKDASTAYERASTLNRMMRAWLRFSTNQNINSWLSHETLLGCSLNGFTLPWNYKHEVQITATDMWKLAKYFGQSLVVDVTLDDPFSIGYGQYFLDISPSFFDSKNKNGKNTVDARFIDIHSGMYIEISALVRVFDEAYTLKQALPKADVSLQDEFGRMLSHYNVDGHKLVEDGAVVGSKSLHFYNMDEVNHLERVVFEGEYGYIPSEHKRVLEREYSHRYSQPAHPNYTWREKLKMWVEDYRCNRDDKDGESCLGDEYVNKIFKLTHVRNDGGTHRIDTPKPIFPDWEALTSVDRGIA